MTDAGDRSRPLAGWLIPVCIVAVVILLTMLVLPAFAGPKKPYAALIPRLRA